MTNFSSIADRLCFVIEANNMTQKEFARKLEIAESSVSGYCSGAVLPGVKFLIRICTEFDVDLNWLLTGEIKETATAPTPARESALVDNYHHMSDEDKRVLEKTASALAQSSAMNNRRIA